MPFDNIYGEKRMPGFVGNTWRVFRADNLAMVGFYGVLVLLLLCLFGATLSPYALDQQFMGFQLLPPSWSRHGNVAFFLGTDDLGRDVLSRLLNGVAPTFGSACLVALATALIGLLLGSLAAISRGVRSAILHHILDTLLSIPSLLMAIVIVAFIGPSLLSAMLATWLAILPHTIRAVYQAVHGELEKEYVIAARLDGANHSSILWFTVMPNIAHLLVTELTRVISIAILDISALGFLNLGAQLPSTEWGAMMSDSLELLYVAPWTVMLPGALIMITVLLVNLLGDGVRRAILTENE